MIGQHHSLPRHRNRLRVEQRGIVRVQHVALHPPTMKEAPDSHVGVSGHLDVMVRSAQLADADAQTVVVFLPGKAEVCGFGSPEEPGLPVRWGSVVKIPQLSPTT